jgi:hypothetical protein
MKRLLAGAATLLASLALAAPASYDIFPETRSPNGRWAIGWGIPGKSLDSARLRAEEGYFESVSAEIDRAEDYLIDRKSGKIVTKLAGFKSFYRENNASVSARWAPDGRSALVTYHGKWEPRKMAVLALPSGAQSEILAKVRNDVFRHLDRKGGKSYKDAKGKLAIELNDATLWPGKLRLTLTASVPKEEEGYSATVIAAYPLSLRGGRPRLGDVHILPPKK